MVIRPIVIRFGRCRIPRLSILLLTKYYLFVIFIPPCCPILAVFNTYDFVTRMPLTRAIRSDRFA